MMRERDHIEPNHPDGFKQALWNFLMLGYLVTGLALAPLIIGETLVALGWLESMNEQTMPSWIYGYVVLTMYLAAFAVMIAWLPALLVCVLYWNRWRAVVPSLAVILFALNLFLVSDEELSSMLLDIAAITYVLVASGVGIEWLIRNIQRKSDPR
jgi:hypothetical protein